MAGKTDLSVSYSFTFRDGNKIPLLRLGTWQAGMDEDMEPAVYSALESGYRHIDTAFMYFNEKAVGNAIRKWIQDGKGKREDVFVTTKLPPQGNRASDVNKLLKKSLNNLGLDYVDLYLIHTPMGMEMPDNELEGANFRYAGAKLDMSTDLIAIWKAMEAEVDAGRAKLIGVSNFNGEQVERIVKAARIIPACDQVECHVHFQQKPLRSVLDKNGIILVAYASLGSPGRTAANSTHTVPNLLEDPTVLKISEKHKKSPSHVLVRFLLQEGMSVIPKSKNPERIKDNINLYDFSLDAEDMNKLRCLGRGEDGRSFKFNLLPGCENHPEYPGTK